MTSSRLMRLLSTGATVAVLLAAGPALVAGSAEAKSQASPPAHAACAYPNPAYCLNPSLKPSKAACSTAKKLLTDYERVYEKVKHRPLPKKIKESLDRKRHAGTITSDDLPGPLKRKFPGELAGFTLDQVREVCDRPTVV